MTELQLHKIKDFSALFQDERFVGLMMYLSENPPKIDQREPHGMIQDSGVMKGYFEVLKKIRGLRTPPNINTQIERPPAYQTAPPAEQKA